MPVSGCSQARPDGRDSRARRGRCARWAACSPQDVAAGRRRARRSRARRWTATRSSPATPGRVAERGRRVARRHALRPRRSRDGEAIRISTGAAVPAGATAVIRQEDIDGPTAADDRDAAPRSRRRERPRRRRGHARRRPIVLRAGTRLRRGRARRGRRRRASAPLSVARRPRVAVLCTGDELRAPGEPLGPGRDPQLQRPDARPRWPPTAARVTGARAPAPRRPRGHRRRRSATRSTQSDVVIVSGGVSVGPHDHVKPALAGARRRRGVLERRAAARQADLVRHRAATPLVFGLPGNPVSAVVTFSLFVAPGAGRAAGRATEARRSSPRRCSAPPCRATRAASRRSACACEQRRRHARGDPQRPAGVAHPHLAARRRRAGDDPRRRGRRSPPDRRRAGGARSADRSAELAQSRRGRRSAQSRRDRARAALRRASAALRAGGRRRAARPAR